MSPTDPGYGKPKFETPLHIAAACGHDEAVSALLDAGEDFQAATDGGWTALHNAAWFGRVPIVDRLICFGADPKAKTKDGLTLLHCAVKNSQTQIVKLLLDKKVIDVDAEDNFGITPFHMACKCRGLPMMELMHENGIDIERRMRVGWTPLMWAAVVGALDVAQWLISHGAQVNAIWVHSHEEAGDSIELSPLDLANSYHRPGIAKVLKDHGGMDNRSLVSRSSLELPLPGAFEETYDLPEVLDIAFSPLERAETGDSQLSNEQDNLLGEAADSDSADESSDDENRSRKPSASSVEEGPGQRRESSFALHGLGISEENENDMKTQELMSLGAKPHMEHNRVRPADKDVDSPTIAHISQPPSCTDINETKGTAKQENASLVTEPETYDDAQVGEADSDNVVEPAFSSSGVDDVPIEAQSCTDSIEQRKGSGAKSPIALGEFFTRRTWKIGSIGSAKGASANDVDPPQSANNAPQRPTKNDDHVLEPTEGVDDGPKAPKSERGVFDKLMSKRGLSWKKDKSEAMAGNASVS